MQEGRVAKQGAKAQGVGLAPKTVHSIHAMIRQALGKGMELGYVGRNVAELVSPPKLVHREMQALSAAEVARLFASAKEERLLALWHFLVDTGVRIGEALGLKWSYVFLDTGMVRIQRTLTREGNAANPVFREPKTRRSRRSVTLTRPTIALLKAHRDRQTEERVLIGENYPDYGLVFCTRVGTPLSERNVLRNLKALLERAKLPGTFRVHDLRHTNATLLLEAGVNPRVLADRLGYAQVSTTLDTYSHVTPNLEAQATGRLERAIYGEDESVS